MISDTNKNNQKPNKAEEPLVSYNAENIDKTETELHPILIKLLEESKKQADSGQLISHDEALRRISEKIQSLKLK
jgi:hypothetical protein